MFEEEDILGFDVQGQGEEGQGWMNDFWGGGYFALEDVPAVGRVERFHLI